MGFPMFPMMRVVTVMITMREVWRRRGCAFFCCLDLAVEDSSGHPMGCVEDSSAAMCSHPPLSLRRHISVSTTIMINNTSPLFLRNELLELWAHIRPLCQRAHDLASTTKV